MKDTKPSEPPKAARQFPIKVARSVGKLAQRVPYEDDELLISLGNSLKLHEQSVRQSRSLWGRLRRVFASRIDPDSIEIDGMRLQQLLAMAGTLPSADISVSNTYILDIAGFRSLLKSATENLNERTLSAGEVVRD